MRRYTYDDMSVMAEKLLPYIKTDRYQLFIRDPDDKDANYWIPENLPDFRFIVNRMLEGIGSRAMEDLIDLLRAYAVRDSSYQLNTDAHYTLFKNGIFDITSGDSITKPDAMFSYRCPHNLNMEATSNGAVDNFLELVSRGDKTIESAILAMGGAAITGYNPAGRIFFLLDDVADWRRCRPIVDGICGRFINHVAFVFGSFCRLCCCAGLCLSGDEGLKRGQVRQKCLVRF